MQSENFRVTATIEDLIQNERLDHDMIKSLTEHVTPPSYNIGAVKISMDRLSDDVISVGVIEVNSQFHGFEITRGTDSDGVILTINIDKTQI